MRPEKVSRKTTNLGRLILLPLALLGSGAFFQKRVPFVNEPLAPSAVAPAREHSFERPAQGASTPRRLENYGKLPMAFEPNLGQSRSPARFLARGRGYALFLTGDGMVLSLRSQKSEGQSPVVSSQSSVATITRQRISDRVERFTIHNSPFTLPFTVQSSGLRILSNLKPEVCELFLCPFNARGREPARQGGGPGRASRQEQLFPWQRPEAVADERAEFPPGALPERLSGH